MKSHLPTSFPFHLCSILSVFVLIIGIGSQANLSAQDITIEPEFYELSIIDEATKKHGYILTNNTQESVVWLSLIHI